MARDEPWTLALASHPHVFLTFHHPKSCTYVFGAPCCGSNWADQECFSCRAKIPFPLSEQSPTASVNTIWAHCRPLDEQVAALEAWAEACFGATGDPLAAVVDASLVRESFLTIRPLAASFVAERKREDDDYTLSERQRKRYNSKVWRAFLAEARTQELVTSRHWKRRWLR